MLQKVKTLWEQQLEPRIPPALSATTIMRGFGLIKVPMLFYVRPSVVEITDKKMVVKIPLSRRSKNHLNSMYFGALAVGADAVIGMLAMHWIRKKKAKRIQLVFKNFQINFLKRPEGDVHFICEEGDRIRTQLEKAIETGERVSEDIKGYGIVPSRSMDEHVIEFSLGLSLKKK